MSSIGNLPEGAVNPADGSLQTTTTLVSGLPSSAASVPVIEYQEELALAKNTPTELLSYTVPVAKKLILTRIAFGGDNIAAYVLKFDGITKDKFETYFGGGFCGSFDFFDLDDGYPLAAGVVITVEVTHFRPDTGDFHSRLQGVLVG